MIEIWSPNICDSWLYQRFVALGEPERKDAATWYVGWDLAQQEERSKMKATLIDYTGKGSNDAAHYAAAVLAFTKSTRLKMSPGGLDEFFQRDEVALNTELAYMAHTIPSSWEFVDYTFNIEGVTRAFTHQFVRTRTASFAQQTMRVLDVSEGKGWEYLTGPSISDKQDQDGITDRDIYDSVMETIDLAYKALIARGVKVEDARGILPTNILTNICVKMNMRTFVDMVGKRSSPRTQGEYRAVLDAMKAAAIEAHPWLVLFLERDKDIALKELDSMIINCVGGESTRIQMIKLVDQIRKG